MSKHLQISPPAWALKLLRWFCDERLLEDVEGDVRELFNQRFQENHQKARLLFWVDVLLLFRPGIVRNFQLFRNQTNYSMFSNYFKIAFRNSIKYKEYSILNLLGLVVGITSSMMILIWVNDEVSINQFHKNGDQIYQLFRNMRQSGGLVETTPSLPKPVGDLMSNEYSEVDEVAFMSWEVELKMEHNENTINESGRYASPSFLQLFSFPLLAGDVGTALNDINSIVISESVAKKHFGEEWKGKAIGQSLVVRDIFYADSDESVVITGVMKDIGSNSTLQFDWLLPANHYFSKNKWVGNWGNGSFQTFIRIPEQERAPVVADRVLNVINEHSGENDNAGFEQVILHKFEDVYLHSNFDNGVVSGGRIGYVRIMSVVAIFILIVACINFMNLTTARSNRRSKEIGLRKVMGAQKRSIGIQFYFEAFIFAGLSVALSVALVYLLLPYFNDLVGKVLIMDFSAPSFWLFAGGIILVVGFLSGSYPAILLPTFNIIQSLKGGIKQSVAAMHIRKALVVFQFAISVLLIIGTSVIYKQINYVLNKDLGLNKENVVAVTLQGDLPTRLESYKSELLRIPGVKEVTTVSGNPINYGRSTSSASWEGKDPSEGYEINVILTDEDFIQTMDMEIISGRDFSMQINDSSNFIINEVAVELMGFDDPLGKKLSFWGVDGTIVGVVKNFHMRNLYDPIAPVIITCIDPAMSYLALVRIEANTAETLAGIQHVTERVNPDFQFEYEFLDQAYAESYQKERTVSTLVNIFAVISILISCLGIYGLASYSADQRSKEIGVRKVHGSTVNQILILLSRDYIRLILIAFVVAIPFGYITTNNWLNNFEFSTHLNPWIFLPAGLIVFAVGVLTVIGKSYFAASANPVNSIRDE